MPIKTYDKDGSAITVLKKDSKPKSKKKVSLPQYGTLISPAEIITMLLQREGEGDRCDALNLLADTLAELGITGEEIAHYQTCPGICHDCNETDEEVRKLWMRKLKSFPTRPFETGDTYWKADLQDRIQVRYGCYFYQDKCVSNFTVKLLDFGLVDQVGVFEVEFPDGEISSIKSHQFEKRAFVSKLKKIGGDYQWRGGQDSIDALVAMMHRKWHALHPTCSKSAY